jgi:succinoglycan biosynthesis protein ExoM
MSTASHPSSVDICICTFRRPFLAETLKSVGNLAHEGLSVRVVVADNDSVPSAQPLVEMIGRHFPFPITYIHAPAANISVARNACLDNACADYVAFVDDDETLSEGWLAAMVRAANIGDGDVVLGPVIAQYDASAPAWMIAGDFHSTAPVRVGGSILTGYTCNVLIRWQGPARSLRFDLALGRSGGEDTDFFYRLHDLGARILEAPAAVVFEPVPPSRARMSWLLQRRFRSGQTHGARLRAAGSSRIAPVGTALAKIGYCLVMAAATAFSPVAWRRNVLRAALHAGVVGGLAGSRQAALYGEANEPVAGPSESRRSVTLAN